MDLTTAILDSVSVGVIVLDRNEVVHVWNEFMAVHSGVSARDAIGRNVFDVVPDLPRAWILGPSATYDSRPLENR
jgi:diguanylate cyclase